MIHVDPAHIAPDPAPTPADAPASARARIDAQLVMLDRLARIGMELAEACGREAKAAPADNAAARPHPCIVFARVARAVRMTIALQSRLMKDLAALDRADDLAERARTAKRRIRLSRLVEEAVRAKVTARREAGHQFWADEDAIEDEIEQLSSEAYERLVDAEDDDLSRLSFAEAAAGIAADLGLSPDWTARLLAAAAPPDCPGEAPGHASPAPLAARPPDPEPPPPGPHQARPAAPPRPPP